MVALSPEARALRIGYAGTPTFARVALQALIDAGAMVPLVLTQPDRPAGRGLKLQASEVKQLAQAHGIPVAQPRSLRLDGKFPDEAAAGQAALQAANLDVLVVAAYGLILPAWVLATPRHGCLNIHGSLLPRWRGAAPIHRAIEAGDAETGVTIMQMDEGLDTGAMLHTVRTPIGAEESTAQLHDRLAALGAEALLVSLNDLAAGRLQPVAQPEAGVNYAHKIDKAEGQLDWSRPAAVLARQVRAFDPFPGCAAEVAGQPVKLWRAAPVEDMQAPAAPGSWRVDGDRLLLACGPEGREALSVQELQRPGGKRIGVAEFLRGLPAR